MFLDNRYHNHLPFTLDDTKPGMIVVKNLREQSFTNYETSNLYKIPILKSTIVEYGRQRTVCNETSLRNVKLPKKLAISLLKNIFITINYKHFISPSSCTSDVQYITLRSHTLKSPLSTLLFSVIKGRMLPACFSSILFYSILFFSPVFVTISLVLLGVGRGADVCNSSGVGR